jgi:hypothetical protein
MLSLDKLFKQYEILYKKQGSTVKVLDGDFKYGYVLSMYEQLLTSLSQKRQREVVEQMGRLLKIVEGHVAAADEAPKQ